ncbi:Phosphatidylinositol-glycan biosynthesis class F protein [Vulpes lagopus]
MKDTDIKRLLLVLETFLFAVILSTFTTVPCLCLLGPNIKAWLRVFSRNGQKLTTFGELKNLNFWREVPELVVILRKVTSIWENSLQITTISSFIGTWLGAFPIPLDWERPWYGPSPARLERPLATWLAL